MNVLALETSCTYLALLHQMTKTHRPSAMVYAELCLMLLLYRGETSPPQLIAKIIYCTLTQAHIVVLPKQFVTHLISNPSEPKSVAL